MVYSKAVGCHVVEEVEKNVDPKMAKEDDRTDSSEEPGHASGEIYSIRENLTGSESAAGGSPDQGFQHSTPVGEYPFRKRWFFAKKYLYDIHH